MDKLTSAAQELFPQLSPLSKGESYREISALAQEALQDSGQDFLDQALEAAASQGRDWFRQHDPGAIHRLGNALFARLSARTLQPASQDLCLPPLEYHLGVHPVDALYEYSVLCMFLLGQSCEIEAHLPRLGPPQSDITKRAVQALKVEHSFACWQELAPFSKSLGPEFFETMARATPSPNRGLLACWVWSAMHGLGKSIIEGEQPARRCQHYLTCLTSIHQTLRIWDDPPEILLTVASRQWFRKSPAESKRNFATFLSLVWQNGKLPEQLQTNLDYWLSDHDENLD